MSEERLADLEARLVFQEDAINKLSDAIYRQEKQIEKLELQTRKLVERLREVSASIPDSGEGHQPPPHY